MSLLRLLKNKKPSKDNDNKYIVLENNISDLEHYLKDLKKFAPTPLCYVNRHNVILDVNKSFMDFSGYGESEIVGEKIEMVISEDDAENIVKKILDNKNIINQELLFVKKDKNNINVVVSAMPRISNDNIIGYFISFYDISDMKETQKILEEKNKELEVFNKLAVGREMKMLELKKEIDNLKAKSKK